MKLMILIATLSSGAMEWQSIPAHVCAAVELATINGETVLGERGDGSTVEIVEASCHEDTLLLRMQIEPSVGACEMEAGA